MREFSQTLSDFVKGLRPDANTPRNSGFATELYNVRCGVAGLEVPPLIINPISGAPAVSWPLPQLIKIYDLNFADTGLYFVNYASGNLTIKKVATDYSLSAAVFTKAGINSRFTVADLGYYQVWAATGLVVKRHIADDLLDYEWTEVLVNGVAPSVTCVCAFRGQLIAGIYTPAAEAIGGTEDNLVAWSEIGSVTPTIMFNPAYGYIDRDIVGGGGDPTVQFSSDVMEDSGRWKDAISAFSNESMIFGLNYPLSPPVGAHSFMRFPNVTIPAGSTILSAYLRFTAYQDNTETACSVNIYFNDVDDAVAPTDGEECGDLVLGSPVAWSSIPTWTSGGKYNSADISSILQTVINRSGWASGQAVMAVIHNNGSDIGATRRALNNEETPVELHVTYVTETPNMPYKRTSGNYRTGPKSVVRRVLPLGNGVMVYCSDKIFYMPAVSSPVPTFGITPVMSVGIPSTFCAEGDEKEHVFITTNKEVYRVQEGKAPEYLGYKEYIGAMSGTIVISVNQHLKDYYISNGSKTHLLSPLGMSEWFQHPTSIVWEDVNRRLIGPIVAGTDLSAYMATDVFDFGVRSIKVLTLYEIGGTGQIMTANANFKYKVTDTAFTASRFKTVSGIGTVVPNVAGVEFKMRVKGADYTKFDLDYLTVRYKYVDKRGIRGAYATDAKVLPRTGR